jgi:hypothetical protein
MKELDKPPLMFVHIPRLFLPGLFDVRHRFALEPIGAGRTQLSQSEQFRGVLIPFVSRTLRRTQEAFGIANNALKARVEGLGPNPGPTAS